MQHPSKVMNPRNKTFLLVSVNTKHRASTSWLYCIAEFVRHILLSAVAKSVAESVVTNCCRGFCCTWRVSTTQGLTCTLCCIASQQYEPERLHSVGALRSQTGKSGNFCNHLVLECIDLRSSSRAGVFNLFQARPQKYVFLRWRTPNMLTHQQQMIIHVGGRSMQHLIKINLNNQQSLIYFRLEQAQL